MKSTWQNTLEIAKEYRLVRIEYWLNEVLFSLNWWILLITAVSLLITWIIILDKQRKLEIISYGLMVAIIANFGI